MTGTVRRNGAARALYEGATSVTWPWMYVIHVGNGRSYLQRGTAQRPGSSATAQRQQATSGEPWPERRLAGQWRVPIDGGSTERFDAADLQEAKALRETRS
jgi:hypothetical protein